MRGRGLCFLAAVLASVLHPVPCEGEGASWSYHRQEIGGYWAVGWIGQEEFIALGDDEGGTVWRTWGGVENDLYDTALPVPRDSLRSVAYDREGYFRSVWLVSMDGRLWQFEYGLWYGYLPSWSDSLGVTAAMRFDETGRWYGTNRGRLLHGERVWMDLPESPIRDIFPFHSDSALVLFDDGRLLAPDSVWVAAPFLAALVHMASPDLCVALERETRDVWTSTDSGRLWTRTSEALASPLLAPHAAQARRLVMGPSGFGALACGDALLVTEDAGVSWRIAGEGKDLFLDVALDEIESMISVGARVHRSTDRGASLRQIGGVGFEAIETAGPATLWALDRGLLLSTDAGDSWQRLRLPEPAGTLRRIAASGDYDLLLHFDGPDSSRTYATADRGETFFTLDAEGRIHGIRGWSFPDARVGWAYTDSTILRSEDGGALWEEAAVLPGRLDAFAAFDSLRAARIRGGVIEVTEDGGAAWIAGSAPPPARVGILSFAGPERIVIAGEGAWLLEGWPPGEPALAWPETDTILALSLSPDGSGWAAGRAGLLVEVRDGGTRWEAYRSDLQINGIDTDLVGLDTLNGRHAAACGGRVWLTLQPDGNGPEFRIGLAWNPHLRRHVDVHVTAHERLQGDTLGVWMDEARLAAEMLDPDGFLYLARAVLPPGGGEHTLTVRGSDMAGNERTSTRAITSFDLGEASRSAPPAPGLPVLFDGVEGTSVLLLEQDAEAPIPRFPDADGAELIMVFQVACTSEVTARPAGASVRLALWDGRTWAIAPEGTGVALASGATFAVQSDAGDGTELGGGALRVFPTPCRDACTVLWRGSPVLPVRWELYDLLGRRIDHGEEPAGSRAWVWPARDGRDRPLSSGVYWLCVRSGPERAAHRILVTR